jgi:gliding motility-associated lipoprotein GldH
MTIRLLFLFVTSVLCFGCKDNFLINDTKDIPNLEWTYTDSLTYNFTITDTSKVYNMLLDVEHSPEYSWQNLYVRVHTTFPSGKQLSKNVSLDLADTSGKWLGDCNSKACHTVIALQPNAFFNPAGKYAVTVAQHMRQDSIRGVYSVGLLIEDTGKKR